MGFWEAVGRAEVGQWTSADGPGVFLDRLEDEFTRRTYRCRRSGMTLRISRRGHGNAWLLGEVIVTPEGAGSSIITRVDPDARRELVGGGVYVAIAIAAWLLHRTGIQLGAGMFGDWIAIAGALAAVAAVVALVTVLAAPTNRAARSRRMAEQMQAAGATWVSPGAQAGGWDPGVAASAVVTSSGAGDPGPAEWPQLSASSRSASRPALRHVVILLLTGAAVGVVGGASVRRFVADQARPPVRARMSLSLPRMLVPEMARYARSLAAQAESRFHVPGPWPTDLRVIARPPPCFGARLGCSGPTVEWTMEIRTSERLDPRAAAIVVGPGELTARPVVPATGSACQQLPVGSGEIAQTVSWVPASTRGRSCESLGTTLWEFIDTKGSAAPPLGPIPDVPGRRALRALAAAPQRVPLELGELDAAWFQAWSRSHPEGELAVVLDGWIIAVVPAGDLAGTDGPVTRLETVGVHGAMGSAITTAVNGRVPPMLVPELGT